MAKTFLNWLENRVDESGEKPWWVSDRKIVNGIDVIPDQQTGGICLTFVNTQTGERGVTSNITGIKNLNSTDNKGRTQWEIKTANSTYVTTMSQGLAEKLTTSWKEISNKKSQTKLFGSNSPAKTLLIGLGSAPATGGGVGLKFYNKQTNKQGVTSPIVNIKSLNVTDEEGRSQWEIKTANSTYTVAMDPAVAREIRMNVAAAQIHKNRGGDYQNASIV